MDSYLQQLNRDYNANPGDQDVAARLISALRRVMHGGKVERYQPRNLPCNIVPDDQLWCVCGGFTDENGPGGGVLEWCYNESDALVRKSFMARDPRYSDLSVRKWKENDSDNITVEPGLSLSEMQSQTP